MKPLPEQYRSKIQSNLTVIWWGRRAFYEVVEELSAALWWSVWLGLIVGHFVAEMPKWVTWQSTLAVGLIYLYIWYEALIEIELWRNEIFAVGFDSQTGEGRIYKFFVPVGKSKNRLLTKPWQVWSRADFDDQITLNSPAPQTEEWWWYRFWGWLTQERMMRLKLSSVTNTYVEGQRVSPELLKAIKQVRANQPKKQQTSQEIALGSVREITNAMLAGHITQSEASQYTRLLFDRVFYGEL